MLRDKEDDSVVEEEAWREALTGDESAAVWTSKKYWLDCTSKKRNSKPVIFGKIEIKQRDTLTESEKSLHCSRLCLWF